MVVGEQGKKAINPFQLNFKINWELQLCVNIRQAQLPDAFVLYAPPGAVSSKLLGFEFHMISFLFLLLFYYNR